MRNTSKAKLDALIGHNIREIRERIGLSREELARSVGITSVYVGLIERGQRGTELLNLFRIAESLGISFSELFMNTNGHLVEENEFNINIASLLTDQSSQLDEVCPENESSQKTDKAMFYISNMSEKQLDLTLLIMSDIYKSDF